MECKAVSFRSRYPRHRGLSRHRSHGRVGRQRIDRRQNRPRRRGSWRSVVSEHRMAVISEVLLFRGEMDKDPKATNDCAQNNEHSAGHKHIKSGGVASSGHHLLNHQLLFSHRLDKRRRRSWRWSHRRSQWRFRWFRRRKRRRTRRRGIRRGIG